MNTPARKGLSYARRMHLPRTIGFGVGVIAVAGALYPSAPRTWVWVALLLHGYVWPQVALMLSTRSKNPYNAERRNLLYDSFGSGFWAGAMGFCVLPMVATITMIAMNNIAAGGTRLWVIGTAGQIVGGMVGYWVFVPDIFPDVSQFQIYACLPVLIIYPVAIGLVCYKVAVQLSQSRIMVEKLSSTDSLTGLLNHGAWKDQLALHFNDCQASERQSAVALIDLDYFKAINDTYGHITGDNVLKHLSKALTSSLRVNDVPGRYGGDEFCVILPETSRDQAAEILERLRCTFHDLIDSAFPDLKLSLSIGFAAHGPHLNDASAWLHAADMALYDAKSAGRNCVRAAEPASFTP